MIKGVIFDWNGTLSDDTLKIFAVATKIVKKTGGTPLSLAEFRRKVRNPYYPFYRDVMHCNVPKAEIERWYQYYSIREKTAARLFPDAVPLLKFLNGRNIKVGIVSSHPAELLAGEIKAYGIGHLFGFVRGGCHTKASHVNDFLRHYMLRPKEVIFAGDMVFDIEEGNKCGVITAACLKGMDSREKLLRSKPGIILPSLAALKKLITAASSQSCLP